MLNTAGERVRGIVRNKWVWIGLAVVLTGFLLTRSGFIGGGDQAAGRGEPTITFGFTPWTTTFPGTYVAKQLIEDELGYPTELEQADVGVVYAGLARGDVDIFMDSWLPELHRDYIKEYGDSIEDASTIYTNAIVGWGVPEFVDESIQSIADLNDHRELFEGRVVGIDPGAGMSRTSRELIEQYGLDFEYIASSEAAMLTEVETAFREQKPLLFLVYRPHTMFTKWDIRVLEDPEGIWEASEIHAMVNNGLKEKAPDVHTFISRFKMPLEDYEAWIFAQDEEGADPEQLAQEWIEQNSQKVRGFLEGL